MALGIQSGSVVDRSFNSGGLMNALDDLMVEIPANHGGGWYMWDDRRLISSNPYVVYCNQAAPTPNSKAMFVQIQMSTTQENVYILCYLWWDNVTHTGSVPWAGNWVRTVTGSFAYYFRGGPDLLSIITRIGTQIDHWRLSRWAGIWNATTGKGCEPETASGVLASPAFTETGDDNNQVSGYHNITGYIPHLDPANGKLYFNVVKSGANISVDIFSNSARTTLIGHTTPSATIGARAVTQDNSSGLGGTITIDANVAADTDIECSFLRLTLGAGQGANFTVGRRYFLIDLAITASPLISYLKVLAINGDVLTVDYVGARPFQAGGYISPFPHRWIVSGNLGYGSNFGGGFPQGNSWIPFTSRQGFETQSQNSSQTQYVSDWMQNVLDQVNPDDDNEYPCQFPWVVEAGGNDAASSNRFWGKEINTIVTAGAGMSALQDRRVLNGIPYIAINNGPGVVTCLLDQEST
jgi:hypothetical protein